MRAHSRLTGVVLKLASLLLTLLIFLSAFPAYALDNNYVISEYNGWIDVDDCINYEKSSVGFDGFLKKIVDEENGCLYIYFSFYDVRLNGFDDENIVISFDVWNDVNSYSFSVNKNGFINTGTNEQKNIKIAYNFDSCSINSCGGEILIGFELTNQIDRQLYNNVRCEYSGGINKTEVLFNNQSLDMYVEPTVKAGTTKAEKTTKVAKPTAVKNITAAKEKSEKTSTESSSKTTKYTPTGTVKSNTKSNQPTQFSGNKVYLQGNTAIENDSEYESTVASASDAVIGSYKMSKTAVIVMAVAVVLVAVGVALVITGLVSKGKKDKNTLEVNMNNEN